MMGVVALQERILQTNMACATKASAPSRFGYLKIAWKRRFISFLALLSTKMGTVILGV
jgi:hypothetical protein